METPTLLAHREDSAVSSPVLIAHRGLWFPDHSAENTEAAFLAACAEGFGVELDVRRRPGDGVLVVSHDAIGDFATFRLATALVVLKDAACPEIAVNVKEEGYERELVAAFEDADLLGRAFFFDHSPESSHRLLAFSDHRARVLARASDRDESLDSVLACPAWGIWGVWLDQFDSDWVTEDVIRRVHDAGKTAWVVSPELHGRMLDLGVAEGWLAADGICTDVPHLYADWLRGERACLTWPT